MDRLEKIRNAARVRDQKIKDEEDRINDQLQANLDKIKSLAPRIKQLVIVARELKRNGFALGKTVSRYGACSYVENISDGIYHRPGFVIREDGVAGVGVIGGGCCGEDIVFDENGDCIKRPTWGANATKDAIDKSSRLILAFDQFEENFYKYVDNL